MKEILKIKLILHNPDSDYFLLFYIRIIYDLKDLQENVYERNPENQTNPP